MNFVWHRHIHQLICLALFPIYAILGFLRSVGLIKGKYVVIGSSLGLHFNDNAKYLFLNFKDSESLIWITHSRKVANELKSVGLRCETIFSLAGIFACIFSKRFIITHSTFDISPIFMRKVEVVQLWHGFPIKRIGKDTQKETARKGFQGLKNKLRAYIRIIYPHFHYMYLDYLVHAGDATALTSAFGINESVILPYGSPRLLGMNPDFISKHSQFFSNDSLENVKKARDSGKKIVTYMPTHRQELGNHASRNQEVQNFLAAASSNPSIFFVFKSHFIDIPEDQEKVFIYKDVDPYPLLGLTDILVTDYSSVMIDFLILNRPIILFAYDLEQYQKHIGFYYDYKSFAPGKIAKTALETALLIDIELNNQSNTQLLRESCIKKTIGIDIAKSGGICETKLRTLCT